MNTVKNFISLLFIFLIWLGSAEAQQKYLYFTPDSFQSLGQNLIELDANQNAKIVFSDPILNQVGMVSVLKELTPYSFIGLAKDNSYWNSHVIKVDKQSGKAEIVLELANADYLDFLFVKDSNTLIGVAAKYPGTSSAGIVEFDLKSKTQKQIQSLEQLGGGLILSPIIDSKNQTLYGMTRLTNDKPSYVFKYNLNSSELSKIDSIGKTAEYNSSMVLGLVDSSGLLMIRRKSENFKQYAFFYYSNADSSIKEIYRYSDFVTYNFNNQLSIDQKKLYCFISSATNKAKLFILNLSDTSQFDTSSMNQAGIYSVMKSEAPIILADGTYQFLADQTIYNYDPNLSQYSIRYQFDYPIGRVHSFIDYNLSTDSWAYLTYSNNISGFERSCVLLNSQGAVLRKYDFQQSQYGLHECNKIYQFKADELLIASTYGGSNKKGAFYSLEKLDYSINEIHSFGLMENGMVYERPQSQSVLKLSDTALFLAFNNDKMGVYSLTQNKMLYGLYNKGKIKGRPFLYDDFVYSWFEDSLNFTSHILYESNTKTNSLKRLASETEIRNATGCYTPGKSVVRSGNYVYAGQFCSAYFGGNESTGFARINLQDLTISHIGASLNKNGIETAEGVVLTADGRLAFMSKTDQSEGYGKLILFQPSDSSFQSFQLPGLLLGYGLDGPINYSTKDDALYFFCKNAAKASDTLQGIILKFDLKTKGFYKLGEYNKRNFKQSELLSLSQFATGVQLPINEKAMVYPNPSSKSWTILWTNNQDLVWSLYTISGQIISSGIGEEVSAEELKPGIYFLKIGDGVQVQTIKVEKL